MREAIERVIAELEAEHKRNFDAEKRCRKLEDQYYRQGGQDGLALAVNKLKEVLTTDDIPASNRQTSSSSTDDTAK